jgi:hypothetical protein
MNTRTQNKNLKNVGSYGERNAEDTQPAWTSPQEWMGAGSLPPLLPSELPLSSLVETTEGTWQRARWRKSGGGAEEANMLFRTAGLHGEQWSLSFWKAYRDTDVDDKLTAPPMYWKIHLQDL